MVQPVLPQRFGTDHMRRFKRVHFVGIGGAGMSGIAEVMLNLGYQVSGSDLNDSPTTRRLIALGATIYPGHQAEWVEDANVLVCSTAIPDDNPELIRARERRIPVVPRAEMLGELMRFRYGVAVAGTHGKTTTTSLVAAMLAEGGLDPTFVIGGLLNSLGSNARLGAGQYLVAEADESDGSFLMLQPTIAVVTNIDQDHLSSYDNDFRRLSNAFLEFLHHLPFYGVAVVCRDDPVIRDLLPEVTRTVVTFGLDDSADFHASDIYQQGVVTHFKAHLPDRDEPLEIQLNLPGRHNVLNALAAMAVAWELDVNPGAIQQGLKGFGGIGRRFSVRGEFECGPGKVILMDDYGHHPTELSATLQAAREAWPEKRLVVVFQPHRYSRTHDLFDDFAQVLEQADQLVLADVYAAGEAPIAGADSRSLCRAIRNRGRLDPIFVNHPSDCREVLPRVVEDGDVVMLLGAGDIGAVANDLCQHGFSTTGGEQ